MNSKSSPSNRNNKRRKKPAPNNGESWLRRYRLHFILTLSVLSVIVIGAAIYTLKPYSGDPVWVYVPRDASSADVRGALRESLGRGVGDRVYALWRLQGGEPATAHGAYRVQSGEWAVKIARHLSKGMQTPVRVSWTDARTMDQLAAKLAVSVECSAVDFLEACRGILPGAGFSEPEFPAAFVPDTYEVYWSSSADELVRRLLDYRNRYWTSERVNRAAGLGLSPTQAATLASIVEEESAKGDERPKIARLYLNRLKKGMLLQADPTVKFAVGDFSLRRIKGEHLAKESAYNTYKRRGLPPGPIRIASKQGIEAVLSAPSHDYLYMCAKEDFSGYHNFAVDYATHMANARRYQAQLNRRNIH